MSNFAIKALGLYKNYKNGASEVEVLKGIGLEVKQKEFLAIQGPSGAGKSTLLHILGGLDYPSKGEVLFEGRNIYGLRENELAIFRSNSVGFVFQFYHLLPEFSALENVLLPALLKSWREKKKAYTHAKSLLEKVGLSARLHHKPGQLSGGEQQRVAIARALINKPQILLCDEPTGNLDSESGKKILGILKEVNKETGACVILVTHDKDIAAMADRVIYLKDGIILS